MAIGILEVLLVNAKGLADTDFIGRIDPYVVVKYKNQERKTSTVKGGGGKPEWNERVKFRVEYPVAHSTDYKLLLNIMDNDTFSSDDFLGQVTIYLEDLLAIGVEKGSAEIPPKKYVAVSADNSYRGEIEVGLTFNLQVKEANSEEYGGWKESQGYH